MLVLLWEILGDRLSSERSSYLYIPMNYWIVKNHKTCSKLHHFYTTCSKCPPPAYTNISDVDKLKWRIKNEWTVGITLFIAVGDVAPASACLRSCWRQTFWAYDVKMVWLTACRSTIHMFRLKRILFLTKNWQND